MKEFVIEFHVTCETLEQAEAWRKYALEVLDENRRRLAYEPDATGDLNSHCSGHVTPKP